MAQFKVLTKASEWEPFRLEYEKRGGAFPQEGCAVMFAEFDDDGSPVAFQFLQNAIFAEGLCALKPNAHLRTIWNMAIEYAKDLVGSGQLLTMTRGDEQGQRIGKAVERMGFQKTNWNVYRREL